MKHLLNLCILAVAFLINPLWGCGGDTDDFEYDRQDMVDYAVGTWSGTLKLPSGDETEFELVIVEKSVQAREQELEFREVKQPSCSSREFSQNMGTLFVRAAYACVSSSTLSVDARFSTSDGRYKNEPLTGEIHVFGQKLSHSSISMSFPNGGQLHTECDADYKCADGQFSEAANSSEKGKLIAMQKN